jgi:hypothetical protein
MTEADWNACADPTPMLEFLRGKVSDRKMRLFACACCRRIWHLLSDTRSRKAVELSEAVADDLASISELRTAQVAAYQATGSGDDAGGSAATCAEHYDVTPAPEIWQYQDFYEAFHGATDTAHTVVCAVVGRNSMGNPNGESESKQQCNLLRDIFGPLPFRPVTTDRACLTSTVTALAAAIYETRDFTRLPILADALSDGGCDNQDILNHCRSGGDHTRGCWFLDLLLGKN